jgi:hypothetical protein
MKIKLIKYSTLRFLKLSKFYLLYFLYVLITVDQRGNYLVGKQRGYDCTHSKDDSYFIYGSARMYYFDKTKPPTKHYLTYKKYKAMRYPSAK